MAIKHDFFDWLGAKSTPSMTGEVAKKRFLEKVASIGGMDYHLERIIKNVEKDTNCDCMICNIIFAFDGYMLYCMEKKAVGK